ncbi:hypothetical protein CO653_13045 [Rhizobium anhuiense]|nr:hypothetical protein CO653_13045 [Rhizobium anhuiense]
MQRPMRYSRTAVNPEWTSMDASAGISGREGDSEYDDGRWETGVDASMSDIFSAIPIFQESAAS